MCIELVKEMKRVKIRRRRMDFEFMILEDEFLNASGLFLMLNEFFAI